MNESTNLSHTSAALTLFLATTDAVSMCPPSFRDSYNRFTVQTIVSTSLPSISSDLDATSSQYTWVGVAYLLTQTAFQPLYGKISDLVGRKVCISPSRGLHRSPSIQ